MDYSLCFKDKVDNLIDYLQNNDIKAMILGISGGLDSSVCAAICHEASKSTGIPLIGRSLPTKFNKEEETTTADLVGKAFCDNYKVVSINLAYKNLLSFIGIMEDSMLDLSGNTLYDIQGEFPKQQTDLANGNIQARLRMIYLYNLASIHKGMVIDTDNLTEHYLGYWTLHGDVGDYKPIGDLWKTEVFGLAKWLHNHYTTSLINTFNFKEPSTTDLTNKANAIAKSLALKPTAGLGITDSDLEELGVESYKQVDYILQEILRLKEKGANKNVILETLYNISNINSDIINNIVTRHFNSEFKRK